MPDAAPLIHLRGSAEDEPGRRRLAGRVLTVALVLFDLVIVAAALTTPALVLWGVLIVAVVVQISFFTFVGQG